MHSGCVTNKTPIGPLSDAGWIGVIEVIDLGARWSSSTILLTQRAPNPPKTVAVAGPSGEVSHSPVIVQMVYRPGLALLTNYQLASSLGWLDFDTAAADRVATLLRALQEPTTLDVLGLLSIRNAFAQMLHPGTSTLQTRLRYFIFLPWIFRRLESEQVAAKDFSRRLRHYEARLIDCLRHLGPGEGVIGYVAGRRLKTMPSQLYWGGLRAFGLRRLPLSIAEYGRGAGSWGRHRAMRDDDGNVTGGMALMWGSLPDPPKDFLDTDISFELTSDEAQVIVDSVQRNQPESLLAVVFAQPSLAAGHRFPWDLPQNALPEGVTEVVRHARCFSEVTAGPQYVYNVLVARRAKRELGWDTDKVEESQLGLIRKWIELVDERQAELASWVGELSVFWNLLDEHRIPQSTRRFITTLAHAVVDDPRAIYKDQAIHEQIRLREMQLKGRRARLGHRGALENWTQNPVGGQLGYRWSIVRRHLADLTAASATD